jgi:hypothetical protein
MRALLGDRIDTPAHFDTARATLEQVFLKGLLA